MYGFQFLSFVFVIVCTFGVLENADADNPIQIKIRSSEVSVSNSIVTIGDIADVTGGTLGLRNEVAELDVDIISNRKAAVSISTKQIEVRLMLAGIAAREFVILGSENVNVRIAHPQDFQQQVENLVRRELTKQFGLIEADVQIHVLEELKLLPIQKSIDPSNFTAMVIFPGKLPIGEEMIQVDFEDSRGNRASGKILMRILVMKEVLVTKNRIPRGTVITADYVQAIRRPLADNSIEPADARQCFGSVAATDIPQHEILAARYLTEQTASRKKLVNRNEFVDVVIEKGPVTIRLKNAKTLSSGSIGEIVEVLNTSTNKRFTATVRDKHTVVVTD